MALLSDQSIAERAEKRKKYRLTNVSSKLTARETAELDVLAAKRGQPRGEVIRQLILAELAKDAAPSTADPILSEIIGVRLLVVNLLKPSVSGEKPLTPEGFGTMLTEIQKVKRQLALKLQQELEKR